MRKILATLFFIIQFTYFPVNIFGSEKLDNSIKTDIEYASGWTGSGIASDINHKLDLLKIKAKKEKKYLRIKDIKITPEWGYAFIIYELSNITSETSLSTSHVQYASGWTGSGIANDINSQLDLLQQKANVENRVINIKDIKIAPEWGYAFIIYELSNKMSETSPCTTHVQYASGWTGSGIANDIKTQLDLLQQTTKAKNKLLNIKDVKTTPEWGYAYIIYEISESVQAAE